MTTWQELSAYVAETYQGVEQHEDRLLMVFKIEMTGRTQVVHISCQRAVDGTEWAHVISPVGRYVDFDVRTFLSELSDNISGGAIIMGDTVCVRQSIHLPSFAVSGFHTIVSGTAMQADFAELGHLRVDEF